MKNQGGVEEFSINGCPTPQLLPGASCTYSVVFYAKVLGAHHAYLILVDNGTENPVKVLLNGTGVQ